MLNYSALWEIGSTNLLSDTTSFTSLNIGSTELIEDKSFSGIDVTEDTENGTSEFDIADLLIFLAPSDCLLSRLYPLLFSLRTLRLSGLSKDITATLLLLLLARFSWILDLCSLLR